MSGGKVWVPSAEWVGKVAVVVATGPSLTLAQVRTIALARLADRCRVIAVNDSVLPCWFADIAFACDGKWWEARDGLPDFAGRKVQIDITTPPARDDMSIVTRAAAHGYDPRPGHICTHKNSGSMAVQIAAHLGAAPILLVGFDMREVADERHWFGSYEDKLSSSPNISNWIKDFRALHDAMPGRLLNATPGSALDFVPATDLAMALKVG